ncbi:3-hydroxyacyl-CoA dehydrogenase [Acidovorax sp. Leaf76]|uniref:3-hydroxyacyl-CoA dehydrogenase NAD-binding domain-containing protein n=1 Tax=unclassified Acidovorax TaxID=2684926 RepID=UPI0006F7084D|nr:MULTISPECIES: 3-hydroxyacyl-CoA dehydrogenase NAD-binding domain-containing protein [unclassified Acidovorax]KQO25609.1 3-hydroxyacyl-CoA dehydrogenase [Acidovorax sp. Leaf76]KQO29292.1 3-hydroxyacyl-CoA dehydrogenase [Acidovorax sp. Leaf84]KQS25815.1 3-hydroxyacyl-CoA dehydrogenase [Acidovorax sp. Leaf191]
MSAFSTAQVRLERDGDVGVIWIDNPPINAGSAAVRAGLMRAVAQVASDDHLTAAVLIGAGTTFIAGSDLREFGQPLVDPQLPAVISAIEACHKPFVAALHGAALGGGFELALGCDARLAARGTVVGLPEVTLGIIPGAGGTQRLPRLVGIPRAISMICAGERIQSAAALDSGLVDALTDGDLLEAAVALARSLAGTKQRLRDRVVPAAPPHAVADAAAAALKAGKGRPAVIAAIAAVKAAAEPDFDVALASERAAFEQLRLSPEATALRHQFFAERESAKHSTLAHIAPRAVRCAAVIGAGTMGTGIAIAVLDAGFDVLLLEHDGMALERGRTRISDHYSGRVKAGKLPPALAQDRQSRLRATLDWDGLSAADLVIEAVFESLDVKRQVFARIDALARPGAVLASNTSYLDLDAIARATTRPQDVIGLHFFSPANVMRLVEVVRGKASSPDALATGLAFARKLRKLPLLTGNAFGFVGNRLYAAYRRQCEFLIEEGAWPEQVDAALQSFGFAMGPFAVADLSGLDIAWRMRQAQAATRGLAGRYVDIADRLCEAGRWGRKTGAGYYRYPDGRTPEVDGATQALIAAARADKGIVARAISDEEIQRRALLALVNEALLLLTDGIAAHATDIDVALVNGYGFPRWEGGPVFWSRMRGQDALAKDLDMLADCSGPGFVRGDIHQLFQ